jgi:hypothetical protein
MQLDFFAPPPPSASLPLRITALPDIGKLIEKVGDNTQWNERTLSEMLGLWVELYDEFVSVLDEPVNYASQWIKPGGTYFAEASPQARKHYQREFDTLSDGRKLFKSVSYELYIERMETLFAQAKKPFTEQEAHDDELEYVDEFFNEVFQHPGQHDLGKRLPQLLNDLLNEYLDMA